MKRSKSEKSRKRCQIEVPKISESDEPKTEIDFDKHWDEPLFSPVVTKIILFSILTIILIGFGCPETATTYIGKVSMMMENSFHGIAIRDFTAFLRSSFMSLIGGDDVEKPDRSARVVQPETYADDDLRDDLDELEDGSEKEPAQRIKKKSPGDARKNYAKDMITNDKDFLIKDVLDSADSLLQKGNIDKARDLFERILKDNPGSPRAKNGMASCLFQIAEKRYSNQILEQSIDEYQSLVHSTPDVPENLLYQAGLRLSELQHFRGWKNKAIATLDYLLLRFPGDMDLLKKAGVFCLENGADQMAKKYFLKILKIDPENDYAMVHMGFIMDHSEKNYKAAIEYYKRGLRGTDQEIHHGRFYLSYGKSLYMENRLTEQYEVYKRGAELGAFISQWQRSTYNCPGITSRAWWTKEQTGAKFLLNRLEEHWKEIRDEALNVIDKEEGRFLMESEGLTHYGKWSEYFLFAKGIRKDKNCQLVPKTCAILDEFKMDTSCTRGQIKFSLMKPKSHVYPHTGPSNCRLRAHLGLVVPTEGGSPVIRVGPPESEYRTWKEGKFLIFDDSFEHEVWHNGTSFRLILIVDIWHPEVSEHDRRHMSPI